MEKSLIPTMTKFGKWVVLILMAFILIWPLSAGLYWTVYKGYTHKKYIYASINCRSRNYPFILTHRST